MLMQVTCYWRRGSKIQPSKLNTLNHTTTKRLFYFLKNKVKLTNKTQIKFKCKGVHLIINTIAAARTAKLKSDQAAYCMQVHTTGAKLLKVRKVIPQAAWFSCKITLSHHLRPHYTPKVVLLISICATAAA